MELSFDEITGWQRFESMTAAYLRALKAISPHIIDVKVAKSGDGNDGGRDILVSMQLDDGFYTLGRKWVVQCKYKEKGGAVGKSHLSDVNIPSLIHEFGADGYLLVSNSRLSSRLTDQFERLREGCKFGYRYDFWDRDSFLERIRYLPSVWPEYFPKFNRFMKEVEQG